MTETANSEVGAWAARCLPYIERLLAEQGDQAEPELIALQHDLAALAPPRERD